MQVALYIHVPFCTRKCPYCHFYVIKDQDKTAFLKALKEEWKLRSPLLEKRRLESIYFGGGTPYLLDPDHVQEILGWINPSPEVEITLEANPEEITLAKTKAFKQVGINRLSIGMQSLDNTLLTTIGRKHTADQATQAVNIAHTAGIENISVDLMLDLPNQTLEQVKATCEKTVSLPITHLSLYNLVLEPPSLFFNKRKTIENQMPNDALSLAMLQTTCETLEEAGFKRYEISAFAKPGYRSRHNTGYWTGRPFLGLGPSAFSYWETVRFQNVCNLKKYTEALAQGRLPTDYRETLDPDARTRELLAIRLRMTDWLDLQDFKLTSSTLAQIKQHKLIEKKGNNIRLTPQGLLFYDRVASDLI